MVNIINKAIERTQAPAKTKKHDVKTSSNRNEAPKEDWGMSADAALRASIIESYK